MIDISFSGNTVRISGEIDIFCAEQVKEAVKGLPLTGDFEIDMTEVPYIDSSGIGVLLTLYNHYKNEGIRFHILPSENLRRVFSVSKLDALFLKEGVAHPPQGTIVYHDSFEADTRILAFLVDKLFNDLETAGYDPEESQEIVVAVDEAITNAVMETIKATGEVEDDIAIDFDLHRAKSIAVRWEIGPDDFSATVIDHGSGLDIETIRARLPEVGKGDYLSQVESYQDRCNLHMRLNGEEVELKRLGAGLKIMASFMDAIFIDLIDDQAAVSDRVGGGTRGTILNLYRHRRAATVA